MRWVGLIPGMTQMVKDLLSFFYNGETIIEWLVIKSSVVACRLAEYDIILFYFVYRQER